MDIGICLNCGKKMVIKVTNSKKESLKVKNKDLNFCDECVIKMRKSLCR